MATISRNRFAALEANYFNGAEELKGQLDLLGKAFSAEVIRLDHLHDIYPIYGALNRITQAVAELANEELTAEWSEILTTLHGRKIHQVGFGQTSIDTSFANDLLTKKPGVEEWQVGVCDLKNSKSVSDLIDYQQAVDKEAYAECHRRGFFEYLFGSKDALCMTAKNDQGQIVGALWGFFKEENGGKIFHFFDLSCRAQFAHMGVAKALIECAKAQQVNYPEVMTATLNVMANNPLAKQIYENLEFKTIDPSENEKIFMAKPIAEASKDVPVDAKAIVVRFVMASVSLPYLLFNELVRRTELLFRSWWYQ